jgi:hypothetical protein
VADDPIWQVCDAEICEHQKGLTKIDSPISPAFNSSLRDFMDEFLSLAWGNNFPNIDLYVRAGCGAIDELELLLPSIDLFWPRFLGDVIIQLDINDEIIPKLFFQDRELRHSFKIVYTHTPCMTGRIFNQYDYVNIDHHSKSPYIMTIDSDCAFFRPFTPDLMFDENGRLIFLVSKTQQVFWFATEEAVTRVPAAQYGHGMVFQPIAIVTQSLPAFRSWVASQNSVGCYEEIVSKEANSKSSNWCWMCQLTPFVTIFNKAFGYTIREVVDAGINQYRSVLHVKYESHLGLSYSESAKQAAIQSLCVWFGADYFPSCQHQRFEFLNRLMAVSSLYWHMEPISSEYQEKVDGLKSRVKTVAALARKRLVGK